MPQNRGACASSIPYSHSEPVQWAPSRTTRCDDATASVVGHALPSFSHLLPLRLVSFSSGRGRGRMDRSCSYSLLVRLSLFEIVLLENNCRVFCHNKSLIRSLILVRPRMLVSSYWKGRRDGRGRKRRMTGHMTRGAWQWHALLFSRNLINAQPSPSVSTSRKGKGKTSPKGPRLGKTDLTNHTITFESWPR